MGDFAKIRMPRILILVTKNLYNFPRKFSDLEGCLTTTWTILERGEEEEEEKEEADGKRRKRNKRKMNIRRVKNIVVAENRKRIITSFPVWLDYTVTQLFTTYARTEEKSEKASSSPPAAKLVTGKE